MILQVSNLRVTAGPMIRVDNLDLTLEERGCLALLGPNGAGKTASVEAIIGLIPKSSGRVTFDGLDISSLPASSVVRMGLTLVPQLRELFPGFTVDETLLAGANAAGQRKAGSRDQFMTCSRGLRNGGISSPARCLAASSKCSRLAAR